MQPTEGFSIPRRAMDVEDYIDIARRHRGWIFGPFLFTLVASVVGVYMWPDSYESEAVIMIEPQKVPTNMVQSAVNQAMTDRITSIADTIESRNVLTTIIQTQGLYPKERSREPIEDVIETMKGKISLAPVTTVGTASEKAAAFAIRFSYENRYLAQRVTEDLVSRFIDESKSNRSNATYQTLQLMQDLKDQAQKELDEVETKLTQFRVENHGRLPDEVESNRQQFISLETSQNYLKTQYDSAQQAKMTIESNIAILRERKAAISKEPDPSLIPAPPKSQKLVEAERSVETLQTALSQLRQQYTETYPDVVTVKTQLEDARKKRDQIAQEDDAAHKAAASVKRVDPQLQREMINLDEQIESLQNESAAKQVQMDGYTNQMKQREKDMAMAATRIEATPVSQKEYDELTRDRDLAKEKYEDAAAKLSKAQTSEEMENRAQGETLSILDPASLPVNPSEPKRPLDISIAAGIGLLLGIVIAGAREMKDTSLKNLKDVRAYTKMSILGSIPLLENDFVVRRRKRLAWLGWTTACLAAAVVISGSIVYYYATKQ